MTKNLPTGRTIPGGGGSSPALMMSFLGLNFGGGVQVDVGDYLGSPMVHSLIARTEAIVAFDFTITHYAFSIDTSGGVTGTTTTSLQIDGVEVQALSIELGLNSAFVELETPFEVTANQKVNSQCTALADAGSSLETYVYGYMTP